MSDRHVYASTNKTGGLNLYETVKKEISELEKSPKLRTDRLVYFRPHAHGGLNLLVTVAGKVKSVLEPVQPLVVNNQVIKEQHRQRVAALTGPVLFLGVKMEVFPHLFPTPE